MEQLLFLVLMIGAEKDFQATSAPKVPLLMKDAYSKTVRRVVKCICRTSIKNLFRRANNLEVLKATERFSSPIATQNRIQ